MLNSKEEYEHWLNNYEYLLGQLSAAWKFKNKKAIEELSNRVMTTQVQIAICARRLKKEGYTQSKRVIRPSVSTDIKIGEYTPMDFNGVDRNRRK